MVDWENIGGKLLLHSKNTEIYLPTAKDLFSQKENEYFSYNGGTFKNVDSIGLYFSKRPINTKFTIGNNKEDIQISLSYEKKGKYYFVPWSQNGFMDYIIVDNAIHFINGGVETINKAISASGIESLDINYRQYMNLIRELSSLNIQYNDCIQNEIKELKSAPYSFHVEGLKANLFPYQETGCHWLSFMTENNCGCILGDEMGLGKTMQVIALFGSQKTNKQDSHFLVICPVSLLENWKREIHKFYPSLITCIHHGSQRTGDYTNLLPYDVVITSYSNAITDQSMLNMIDWDIVAIDEAQNIKNPHAQRTRGIKGLNRKMTIAISGTPFENHMTDIWSIVDFILPNYLGSLNHFEHVFVDNIDSAKTLESFITPIMIRRKVNDVAKDLPKRVDIPQAIVMTIDEAKYYEDCRASQADMSKLKSMKLELIQGLRMFCTHPMIYNKNLVDKNPRNTSNKYDRMCEILEEIFENNEKAIIFTSFNEMISIIVTDIKRRYGVYTNYINGSINPNDRQKIIDDFSSISTPGILVLNPKAAGVGLNITAANHVIHYNLEWNPAVEDQASARSYRRGQQKTVFIHRLYYAQTIEEIINEKIQRKRNISEAAIVGNEGNIDEQDLLKAMRISPFNN